MQNGPAPHDDIDDFLRTHEEKEMVRFVVVGSVDDGKSTLIGRLLYDTSSVFDDQVKAVRKVSKMEGTDIDFSLFTDGLQSEREQGITIDVAYRYFATKKRKFIIADTPGHIEYTRNMATGASTAEIAVILIDARLGVLPQSVRHATIAALFGIRHLVVAVNKMDLVDFAEDVFRAHKESLDARLVGLDFASISYVPVSAVRGDNIVAPSGRAPYYNGPTLLGLLETLPIVRDEAELPLRLPVQLALRPSVEYRGYAGRIESGRVRRGDEVLVLPSGRRTRVRGIDTYEGELEEALAPMSVTIRLEDELDVGRGDVIAHPETPPRMASAFSANLVWTADAPLVVGRPYLMKCGTSWTRVVVRAIDHVKDLETRGDRPATSLLANDIGLVDIEAFGAVVFDTHKDSRRTGAFVLVCTLTNATVGAGMILAASRAAHELGKERASSRVSPDERAVRYGHRGAVVHVSAPTLAEAQAVALEAERHLFDRGVVCAITHFEGERAAEGLRDAGIVALLPSASSLERDTASSVILRLEADGTIARSR